MNFKHINNFYKIFICSILLFGCNTKDVYNKIKAKQYEPPLIEKYDNGSINLFPTNIKQINLDKKYVIKDLINKKQRQPNIIKINNKIFAINKNIELLEFDYKSGELISSKKININISNDYIITSFNYIDDSFLISFKSGLILKFNNLGEIIWKYESQKTLNTKLTVFNDQILALYIDEIKSISLIDGSLIWSEIFEDLPLYQAKGGQLVNFLNLLYFVLPNNKVGSIDISLGTLHNSKFNDIPFISSINNYNDKIYIYENYLVYLDEGKYLYTFDIFRDEFVLYKYNINFSSSNKFYNNSLILKEGNYLQALNILNGNTFWMIEDDKISKKSNIKNIKNIDRNLKIFLDNGDVLDIYNKQLMNINNLGVKNINKIYFQDESMIVNTNTGKIIIF